MSPKLHILLTTLLSPLILCHTADNEFQVPIDPATGHKDWASWHMHSEHHIQGFDSSTFFTLHDNEGTGTWTTHQIRTMYGLLDKSTNHVSEADKDAAVAKILALFDADGDGIVSLEEFKVAWDDRGIRLPDLGMGPGHHGDDEYEYEIHHWEKYHGPDTKVEDLIHPEDIEHFKLHDEEEKVEEEWEEERGKDGTVVERNIPAKFLRADL